MILSILLALATPAAAPLQMRLDPDDRWALVTGLRRQVGGRFILTGLADGDYPCRQSRACTTGEELVATSGTAQARTVGDLVSRTRVYGEQPVAIVSLRGVVAQNPWKATVLFSVYDAQQGRWTERSAVLTTRSTDPTVTLGRRYLTDWKDAPEAPL